MRGSLLWKLLIINIPIIGLVVLVMWLAIDYLAADYFTVLMKQYNIDPAETHQMFLDAVHRYLVQASIAAVILAVAVSFLFMRRLLRPLSDMGEVTRRVASGDFSARVNHASDDEVGKLAVSIDQMANSLEHIESLRKTMVVDMAHELRTPLTNVRGYLEGLKDGVIPPDKNTFTMLHGEILRLVRLVEDLNQLTKADTARTALSRSEIEIPRLVQQVTDLYTPELDARQITVETSYDEAARKVIGDRDKILQILRNLLQNALRYSPAASTLRVTTEHGRHEVKVTVANAGEGISAEDLPFVFERFYRADKSRSRDSGGAGIGLAIVKGLVEAHGGKVGVESAPGDTRFWFTIPA